MIKQNVHKVHVYLEEWFWVLVLSLLLAQMKEV